jgi:hypothetical protein
VYPSSLRHFLFYFLKYIIGRDLERCQIDGIKNEICKIINGIKDIFSNSDNEDNAIDYLRLLKLISCYNIICEYGYDN